MYKSGGQIEMQFTKAIHAPVRITILFDFNEIVTFSQAYPILQLDPLW